MKKLDYNIEFAHIYVNEDFTYEHKKAARILRKKIRELEAENKTYAISVLIDDYNPSESALDVDKFLESLAEMNVAPDQVIFESDLPKLKKRLLDKMTGKLERYYSRYINQNGKCPCSFLIAAWYLLRLGIFRNSTIADSKKRPFVADRLVTILPERYHSIESKAVDIIMSTRYKEKVKGKLEYIYF